MNAEGRNIYSVLTGDIGVVRLLIENGADVNAKADDGSTPLHAVTRFSKLKNAK